MQSMIADILIIQTQFKRENIKGKIGGKIGRAHV